MACGHLCQLKCGNPFLTRQLASSMYTNDLLGSCNEILHAKHKHPVSGYYPNQRKLWHKNITMKASSNWMKTRGTHRFNWDKLLDSLCACYGRASKASTGPRPFLRRVSWGRQMGLLCLKHHWTERSRWRLEQQTLELPPWGDAAAVTAGGGRSPGSPHTTAASRLTLARRGPVEAHDAVDPFLRVHQQFLPPQLGSALGGREAGGGPGGRSRPAVLLHPR